MLLRKAILAAMLAAAAGACSDERPIAASPVDPPTRTVEGIELLDLRFPCGETNCAAWLYLPPAGAKTGVVVMGHGFAGTRDVGLPLFAEHFARKGIAAFVFDYRHFGASGGSPRQLVDPWRQLDDWKAALTFVRSLDRIDSTRIALWGSSLGGGLALIAAERDGDVQCVVAQAPQIDSAMEGEATFPGAWWLVRLLLVAWSDLGASAFGADPLMVPAIAPADAFGMIVDDAAFRAFGNLVRPGMRYRNAVAARSIFTFDDYNPAVQAKGIKTPVLLIASRNDRFAPFAAVEAFAKARTNVRIAEIDGDHFDIYSHPRAGQAAQLASEFIDEQLESEEIR